MEENKLVKAIEHKTFPFDLPKDAGINLKHEIYSIIKYNELLPEHAIKNEITQLLSKYKHRNDIHALQNLSIYYTWNNIKQQYKNNKLKKLVKMWNDEFEFLGGHSKLY